MRFGEKWILICLLQIKCFEINLFLPFLFFFLRADLPLRSCGVATNSGNNWSSAAYDRDATHTEWRVTPHETPPVGLNDSAKAYSPDGDNFVKVVLLGAPGVGKTAIVQVRALGQKLSSKH